MAEKIAGSSPTAPWNDFGSWEERDKQRAAAWDKARDRNFSTAGNPLANTTAEQAAANAVVERNYRALQRDAERRADLRTGSVYSGIMNMRFGG